MDYDGESPENKHLAQSWEHSLECASEGLEMLREIFPLHTWGLNETGVRAIDEAMAHFKEAILALHRAGRHVLGPEQYDFYMQERSEREALATIERGEQ